MAESLVTDWIQEYERLSKEELPTFAAEHTDNHDLSAALFTIFNERSKFPDLIYAICNQLHSFHRTQFPELRRFSLQFLPSTIYTYLSAVAHGERRSARPIETLLICIYNTEIISEDGTQKVVSFRMPVLAQPSMYHDEKSLHPTDLKRWEEYSNKTVTFGPFQPVESLNAQNRMKVMTALMFFYNQEVSLMQKIALYHLCKMASLLVSQGFTPTGHAHRSSYGSDPVQAPITRPPPRIPMSSNFLLELLHATYFAMYNEFATVATQTVEDIHQRAAFELYSDVLLVTNGIKHSLKNNPTGLPADGPMGISIALSPATTSVVMSKSMITNASFRTKKLPDDIPIIAGDDATTAGTQLTSINEDGEATDITAGSRNTAARSSKDGSRLHKIPFGALRKRDKDKDKDKDSKAAAAKNGVPSGAGAGGGDGSTSIPVPQPQSQPMSLSKKLLEKKDKLIGKSSSVANDSIDGGAGGSSSVANEKPSNSPLAILKRKTSSIDMGVVTTQPTSTLNVVPTPSLASTSTSGAGDNGGLPNGGELLSPTYEFGDSFDSESDFNQSLAALTVSKDGKSSMQVSQV